MIHPSPPSRRQSGFTLLELLLSLSITAMIMVLIFGTFRVGMRAWERGERDIEKNQRTRTVLELMRRQVASFAQTTNRLKKNNLFIAFEGAPERISLVSKLALDPSHTSSHVFCQYTIEGNEDGLDLGYKEIDLSLTADPVEVDAASLLEDRHWLLSGVHRIAFDFLKLSRNQGDFTWQPQWNPEAEQDLPDAIRVRVFEGADEEPLSMIIPMRSRERG